MKFSELIADWEDGWRGYALDGDGNKYDFTKDYIIDMEVDVNEEWVKFIEEDEEKDIIVNITVNITGDVDMNSLTEALEKIQIRLV